MTGETNSLRKLFNGVWCILNAEIISIGLETLNRHMLKTTKPFKSEHFLCYLMNKQLVLGGEGLLLYVQSHIGL